VDGLSFSREAQEGLSSITDWAFLEKLKKIIAFRYDWNEVILQFYSTFFFHKNSSSITWMTDDTKYSISIGRFASILGLDASTKNPLNLRDGNVLGLSQMASMYETSDFNAPTITNFKLEMIVLHRVIRKTLAPREGDSSRVPQFERNLLKAITEKTKFNAFDFILQEIWNIAISNNRSCAYAPYIMALIETVSKRMLVKDVEYTPLHPKKQFNNLPPSAASVPSATTTSSDEPHSSSSGRSAFFNLFKGLFSICQSNKQSMDVAHECQEVLLENQQNLHQKMQVEQPFIKFSPVEALPEFLDPLASLTIVEMVYLGMDTPDMSTSHARHKCASTTVPDSDDEIEEEDDGADGDSDDDYEDEDGE
jgi:hypothetical protein